MSTDMTRFGKVAVLMGGTAAEREISLNSGNAVLAALQKQGVDAHGIDVQGPEVLAELSAGAYDRAFIVLHGRGGEDGVMQGALETLGLPYTGSGVLASSLGMDKLRTKQLWKGMGLPTPSFVSVSDVSELDDLHEMNFPVMVKPAHEGSSIGMSKVDDAEALPAAVTTALEYDRSVLIEEYITGDEYTAAVVDGQALPLIRLQTPHDFYDFNAKYQANSTQYHCPCGLDTELEGRFQALAKQAFDGVGAKAWGRVDLMVDGDGQPWLIEVNTVPGMTDHSLVPMAARQAGMAFDALVLRILSTTLEGQA